MVPLTAKGIALFAFLFVVNLTFSQSTDRSAASLNDSASYYFDRGKVSRAQNLLQTSLQSRSATEKDQAFAYVLLGEIQDFEGYSTEAEKSFRKSIQLSQNSGLASINARAQCGIAIAITTLGRYDSVLYYIDRSLALDTSKLTKLKTDLISGQYWQSRNEHDKALDSFQRALELAKNLRLKRYMADASAGIAGIFFYQSQDMKKPTEHFLNALQLYDSAMQPNQVARTLGKLANVSMVLGKSDAAERYLTRAKRITDITQNLPVKGYILSSLAILKAEQNDIAAAVAYSQEPIEIKLKLGQYRHLQNDFLNVGEWNMFLKRFPEARAALSQGVEISKRLKDVVYLEYYYKRFAELDSTIGNYQSAYSNLKRSLIFKDSVIESQRLTAVEEIRGKYEAEQREKIIAEKELVIQQHKYQQSITVAVAVVVLLLFIVILIAVRNNNKARILHEKQQQNQLRLQTIVHTQEEVQQSIARDIHDGLVQVLGAAKVSLQAIQGQADRDSIYEQVKNASQIIDEACVEARGISHQLLPYSLLRDGLLPALAELFKKSLSTFDFKISGEPRKITGDAAINIYRIAQELVNNIVKHSDATFIKIALHYTSEKVTFTVEDNGKGFDTKVKNSGVGLMNMLTRTELIGGVLDITSRPGEGSRFTLEVPL